MPKIRSHNLMHIRSNPGGFSVLELLVWMALLSAVGTGMVSAIKTLHETLLFRAEAQKIEASLHYQSIRSALLDKTISIRTASAGLFSCRQDSCNQLLLALDSHFEISEARFRQSPQRADHISFYADGSASPGHFIVRDGHGRRCTVVQALRGKRSFIYERQ